MTFPFHRTHRTTKPQRPTARSRWPLRLLVLVFALIGIGSDAASQVQSPEELYAEAVAELQSQDWPGAISSLRRVLEIEPEHVPSWFGLGLALTESGDGLGAVEAYRRALAIDDTLFEARMNLAIALQKDGQTREALAEVTQGIVLRPDDPMPALFRAELLDQLNDMDEAERAYRTVIDLDPAGAAAHRRLGSLYRRTGRMDEAYEALLEATLHGDGDPLVRVSLGDIAVDLEDLEAARDHYTEALVLVGEDDEIRLRLALVLNELGSYAEAIPLLVRLDGVEPILAEAYLLAGEFQQASLVYQALALEEPDNVGYWLGLGRSYYELESIEQAIPPLERVVRLDPEREQALGMLAAIYHQYGDYERAAPILLRLLELRPNDRLAHFLIATAYDNMENMAEALLHYNEFLELDDGSNDARTFQVRQRAELLEKLLN